MEYVQYTGPEYDGVFESHITVGLPKADPKRPWKTLLTEADFVKHAKIIGCKPICIEMPSGEHPVQLMANFYAKGNIHDITSMAHSTANLLESFGYVILRTKIEAVTSSKGIPFTDEEAATHPKTNYFEFHVKLALTPFGPDDALSIVSERHGAKISRNAFKRHLDHEERFVTLRLYNVGKDTAEAKFYALKDDLAMHFYVILQCLQEYSVYDTNVSLDNGWIGKPCADCTSCPMVA